MNRIFSLLVCFLLAFNCSAQTQQVHPVFFKLFTPGTLYGDAVHQAVSLDESAAGSDNILLYNQAINQAIVTAFVNSPWLFTTTQTALSLQTAHSEAIASEVAEPADGSLAPEHELPAEGALIDNDVQLDIEVRKPNFWSFDGSGSLSFSQNHFSDNWYKGGEDYYAMLGLLTLHLKYDNKQKLQWETTLDCKLGFQTVEDDEYRKFRVNNDQLRLTTKIGYKASTYWFYTFQAESTTQFCKAYNSGSPDVISDFTSPLKTVLSLGMDYKPKWKHLEASAYIAPLAMTWIYVDRLDLATRYGNDENKHSKITWGPNISIKTTWKPWTNFAWTSRIYYFSNFEYVNFEWENTLTFSFNKYINAKLFLNPRFDDSSLSYRTDGGSYWMFKEWLSLGLEYSF